MFCHEGPWNLVQQRIWILDIAAGDAIPCYRQQQDDSIGHEFWTRDGLIFFDDRMAGHDGTITVSKTCLLYTSFNMLLVNTLAISILNLVFYFPAPIVLALLLNEMKSQFFKRTAQTLVYIPHFISFVIVATLTFQLFNIQDGIVTVSYTHLDVYKRQVLFIPDFPPPFDIGRKIFHADH